MSESRANEHYLFIYPIRRTKQWLSKILKNYRCPHTLHEKQENEFKAAIICTRLMLGLLPMQEQLGKLL